MRKFDLAAAVLITFAGLLLLYQIGKPFWGQFDWTGAWFGTIARNYLEVPIQTTRLAPITVSGTADRSDWTFYNHYTITYPLMVAGSMAIFGDHEWSIRSVSLLFSLLMLGAFYMLCRKYFHPLVGIFGIFAVMFTPMFIYYGKLPIHEQPVLFFSLVSLYFYLAWIKNWNKSDFRKMLLFIGLGFLLSWTGAYILALITIHLLASHKLKVFRLLPAYLLVILVASLHLVHILVSSDINEFFQTLSHRTAGGMNSGKILFTPISFLIKQIKWFVVLFTKPVSAFVILNLIILAVISFKKRKLNLVSQVMLMFSAWGTFQWILVSRIAWIHDYMLIYFLPLAAFSTGLLFWKIYSQNKTLGIVAVLATVYISILTSLPFSNALIFSKDQTGDVYPLAKYLKDNSVSGDRILVAVKSGSDFEIRYPVHYLSYYSDRYIKYGFAGPNDDFNQYKFIVVPNNFANDAVKVKLNTGYKSTEINHFSVYETR